MCLYPKLILNRKYLPNKKNNFNPPKCKDLRLKYVAVGCGKCIECKTQKAREWQVRLNEELKIQKYSYFVTLTFSNEELKKLADETNIKSDNALATIAVRRFLERYRKTNKKSLKHWLITELGHNNTERIHLHGLLFPTKEITNEELAKYWKYGLTYTGDYCNAKTINYIIKYVTKIDNDHKNYEAVILCSRGLGEYYITEFTKNIHKYTKGETKEYYKLKNGQKVNLPIYYRNKLFTEEEREKLWIDRLDKNVMFVRGIEIKNIQSAEGQRIYNQILEEQQKQNIALGYGSDSKEWKKQEYNKTLKMINKMKSTNT